MLALFEVLSLEGWLEVRDVIIERIGPVRFYPISICLLCEKNIIYSLELPQRFHYHLSMQNSLV